jgi:hypothetical protein
MTGVARYNSLDCDTDDEIHLVFCSSTLGGMQISHPVPNVHTIPPHFPSSPKPDPSHNISFLSINVIPSIRCPIADGRGYM